MTKEEMLEVISSSIDKLEKKNFNVFFYVFDTKGAPNSELEYIYQTALHLKEAGYHVSMLHSEEEEFVGVKDWLGEQFGEFEHKNITTENVEITPCDFLFIPEIFTNVMDKTKELPCKKIIIMQNHKFLCDFMPAGITPFDYRITDVITTTKQNENKIAEYFGGIRTSVVRPAIKNVFRDYDGGRKLIVNILSSNRNYANRVYKPFYWKYPVYKWVSFRHIMGVSQEVYSDALREAAITVCVDDEPSFGYSILEAIKCGCIVLAKLPQEPVDWMLDENGDLINSVIWFESLEDVPMMLFSIIRTWTLDEMPEELTNDRLKMIKYISEEYSEEKQKEEVLSVYGKLFEQRKKEFSDVKIMVENNTLK